MPIPNLPQSPEIGQNSNGGISDFRISGQSLIKVNFHNSRTSDDIDIKLGQITKLEKRNKTTSRKFDVGVMSEYCDVIVFFRFLDNLEQPGGRIPDTESAKVMFSVIVKHQQN